MRYDASLHRRGSATHHDPIAHPHGETKSMRRPAAVASRGAYRGRHALPRLSQFAIEHLLVLPVGALVALVWANTRPESYYQFSYTWSFLVNDVVMVLFFGIITKEIVEAAIPGGVLHPWRRLALPLVASGGGFAVAALVFLTFVPAIDEPMLAQAWPVVGAIDLAAIYFVARITFGLHPVLPFVLLLGIVANGICFLILAVFYPSRDLHLLSGAVLMAAAIGMGFAFRRARVRSFWPYVLGGGGLSWCALYWGGLHPALALVPILPFLPHAARDPGLFVDAAPGARDALSRFELWARYPMQVALLLFGLVNAGLTLSALDKGAWAVPVAAFIGKPVGILAGTAIALAAGLHLPHRVGWRELIVVGVIAGVGFTMGLFFTTAILAPGQLLAETKMGVLVTVIGAPLAVVAARLLHVGSFGR
jgi:Na+:H+ antiporter, NhaA family